MEEGGDLESVGSADAAGGGTSRGVLQKTDSVLGLLAPVEESLERRFFAPLAGPERTHPKNAPVTRLPMGPMLTLVLLSLFLLAVFLAALIWPLVNPQVRPPPVGLYYANADIVGLVVTCFFAALLAWSFLSAAFTDPGNVPKEFPWDPRKQAPAPVDTMDEVEEAQSLLRPPSHSNSRRINEFATSGTTATSGSVQLRGLERKRDGRTRFCKKCNMYKPDRAHHCRKLGRCVLEMDHWCPWIRNTVGFKNRKFFFLTVTYGWITLLSYCIVLGPYLAPAAALGNALDFFIIFCFVLALMEAILLLAFWSFHIFLTVHAFTTIEFREKHLAKDTKVRRTGEKIKDLYKHSPYDLGFVGNFKHLLGPNPFLWWIPTRYGMRNDLGTFSRTIEETHKDHPLVRTALEATSSFRHNPISSPEEDSIEHKLLSLS